MNSKFLEDKWVFSWRWFLGIDFTNYIWKLISFTNWRGTHIWFSLITYCGRCRSIKVTKRVQLLSSSFTANQHLPGSLKRWCYWSVDWCLPLEEGNVWDQCWSPYVVEYWTAWVMSVVTFVWWLFFFVVYLFQLAFERHLALQGNNHFTYAL